MTTRKYSSRAQQTTLASSITSGDLSMTVVSGSNLMGGKTPAATETYTVVIDPDTANEEIVDVNTYTSGNTLTIVRARDGSTGVAHSAGAVVRHMVIGRDLQDANDHTEGTLAAHAATTSLQLKNTISDETGSGSLVFATSPTLTTPVIASIVNTGTLTLPTSTDTLVGKATTDTLTNKTFDTAGTGNSFSINGTAITTKTGTGSAVLSASPTITGTAIATNLTASGTVTAALFSGPLTGAVTGNVTGNLTGNVTGNLTGTVTGTSTLDLPLSGGTMTGALTLSGAPTVGLHAATKTYVDGQISGLVNGATAAYDTLQELGALIDTGDTAAAALTATVALKAPIASPTFTGVPAAPTASVATNTTQIATTAYVMAATVAPSNLTGPITSVGAATSIASQTGTGTKFVVDTSPTLVTPVLGVATATSINGTTIPSSVTLVKTSDTLAVHSSTTSAQLAGIISDETGSGSLVFATSPTLVTPVLGTPTSVTLTNATGLPISGITASTSAALGVGTVELGHATDTTIARVSAGVVSIEGVTIDTISGTNTLTNKTLTTPVISSPKISSTYTAKTAAYTFASGDEGQLFSINNAASVQFNIPTDATFNFAVGTEINVFWITGAGQPTIGAVTPGTTTVISTGATSATPKLRVANSAATCKKLAANSWLVIGDIS